MSRLIRANIFGNVDPAQDRNTTRLYAIWTGNTPFIENVAVNWGFDGYEGSFCPTADDRELDTAPDRLVYEYNPNPSGPFRRGIFRDKRWEAWTMTIPALDVQTVDIEVFTFDPQLIVMLGAAVTRNGVVVATSGPTHTTAYCLVDFKQPR